jgi:hypothetical protein
MLTDIIKAQQERAHEQHIVDIQSAAYNTEWLEAKLNTLIADTANATLEYVKGVADEMASKTPWKVSGEPYINATDLIARLTSDPDALKAIE